jgi:hypothetical protein
LSSLTLTLNTIPELQIKVALATNATEPVSSTHAPHTIHYDEQSGESFTYEENPIFEQVETFCIIWFTLEFLLRFLSSPNKLKFVSQLLNIIDFLSVMPYYVSLLFDVRSYTNFNNTKRILTLFKVLRILRIFKLARHFTGLKSLGYTMSESKREIGLLAMFLVIAVLLFSNLAYYAEKDEKNTQFTSIPGDHILKFLYQTSFMAHLGSRKNQIIFFFFP